MLNRRTFIASSVAAAGSTAPVIAVGAESSLTDVSAVEGYNYRLPRFEKGSRLLFQGDSITDMNRGRNEADRNHYLGHSYVYLIAARLGVDLPESRLEFFNRGVSGHDVADLRERWQEDAIEVQPDLLSILIGTNDVANSIHPDKFESDYRDILDRSQTANPHLRLVLMDPFVLRSGNLKAEKAWTSRRTATDRLRVVVAKLASDYGAVHVRTQDVFDVAAAKVSPEYWVWDGIHPLPPGHELIARSWLQEVSARWPQV